MIAAQNINKPSINSRSRVINDTVMTPRVCNGYEEYSRIARCASSENIPCQKKQKIVARRTIRGYRDSIESYSCIERLRSYVGRRAGKGAKRIRDSFVVRARHASTVYRPEVCRGKGGQREGLFRLSPCCRLLKRFAGDKLPAIPRGAGGTIIKNR